MKLKTLDPNVHLSAIERAAVEASNNREAVKHLRWLLRALRGRIHPASEPKACYSRDCHARGAYDSSILCGRIGKLLADTAPSRLRGLTGRRR